MDYMYLLCLLTVAQLLSWCVLPVAHAGAAAALDSSSGLKEPLLSQAPPTLPLLYRPATSEHEGAGYSSPVSSSAAVDFFDASSAAAAAVGTPDGVLPSALTTPSAGAISIRPQGPGPLSGLGRGGQGIGAGGRGRGDGKGLGKSGSRGSGSGGNLNRDTQQELSSGYESDTSSVAGGSEGNRTTAHLSAAWLKPEYYFHGNEPLPPWAGGVARMLAATLAPASSGDDVHSSSSGCFSGALMLPLVFLLLDFVTNLRLLLLWGVGPPPHVKLWPSYALLGLLCVPHMLVGAVVHFRLLAIACLPPALKAAAISEDQLLSEDILPPGAGVVVHVYSWLFGAPAWLAYPLILLLLGPGVLLLTLLCPLVLLMAGMGLGKGAGAVRYIQLLQVRMGGIQWLCQWVRKGSAGVLSAACCGRSSSGVISMHSARVFVTEQIVSKTIPAQVCVPVCLPAIPSTPFLPACRIDCQMHQLYTCLAAAALWCCVAGMCSNDAVNRLSRTTHSAVPDGQLAPGMGLPGQQPVLPYCCSRLGKHSGCLVDAAVCCAEAASASFGSIAHHHRTAVDVRLIL